MPIKSGENIKSIQFLRFVAATLVVLLHSTLAVKLFGGKISQGIAYAAEFGASGVHIFFVISGFIMVYTSFSKGDARFSSRYFLLRRFIRIYPIYWFYCALYLVYHHYVGQGYSLSAKEVGYSLLLLPGYSSLIIGPGWTLSYEVYFYLCFGIAMTLGLVRGLIILSVYFLIAIAFGLVFKFENAAIQVFTNSLLLEFLFGAGIACLFLTGKKLPSILSFTMQILALAGFLGGYLLGYSRLPSLILWGIPSALLLAGLIFSERNGFIFNWVERYSFLGDSSYSLYLIHILLIDVILNAYLLRFAMPSFGNVLICLLLTAVSVGSAIVLFEIVEQNFVVSLNFIMRRGINLAQDTDKAT